MNLDLNKPAGFYYFPDIINYEEEKYLIDQISKLTWEKVKLHGVIAKRRVVHFGLTYNFSSRRAIPGKPFPLFLKSFIKRVAHQMAKNHNDIVEILITEFPIGAGIGWHRDASIFGDIFGISLLSPSIFKLRIKTEDKYEIFKLLLASRSGYILSGEAREIWQHCISPVKQKRYSITFRTLANESSAKMRD